MSKPVSTKSIEIKNKSFYLNGSPFFMFSGEMHYFRMPEKLWKIHIQKARESGINTISSYIPWIWHEYEKGKFDFEGKTHPQRNLVRFLDLLQEAGLYFSARVGPVSNGEMIGEGIPLWLLKNYPDIFVVNKRLPSYPAITLLSYRSPVFMGFVKKWYDQVLPIVSKRQIHVGGNIIMVQLCNEIAMIHWLAKGSDGREFVTKMYQDFLKEKYETIHAINEEYSTSYADFKDLKQPEGDVNEDNLNVFFDWALFYRRYYASYYNDLYRMAKRHAITIPHSANAPQFIDHDVRGRGTPSPMTTSMFSDFSKLSPSTIFGGAYQMRRLDFENFHDVAITTEITKLLDNDAPTICAELQTGIMRDRPRLYRSDVELNIKTSVAHGLNGLNCYMLSSGENPRHLCCFGAYHDWQAPLSLNGDGKDHLSAIKDWGKFIRKHGPRIAPTKKVFDTTLGFYLPYYATEHHTGSWTNQLEFTRTQFFYDGFARLLQLAGFNFSMCDLLKSKFEELSHLKSLCVFSLDFMDRETQKKLAAYVRGGGKLLIGPKLPTRDLKGKPCDVLAQSLGLFIKERKEREMLLWNESECLIEYPPFQVFEGDTAKPILKTASGLACAVSNASPNKGQWLVYGFNVNHTFDYHVEMVRGWLNKLGIKQHIEVKPWDIHTVLRWNGDQGFLFIFNYHDVPKKGKLSMRLECEGKSPASFSKAFRLDRRSASIIPLRRFKNKIIEN
jgi:beta-galactosidase